MDWLIFGLTLISASIIFISSRILIKHLHEKKNSFNCQVIEYLNTPMPVEINVDCDFNLDLTTVERGVITIHEPVAHIMKGTENQEYNSWLFRFQAKPRSLISFEVHAENLNPKHGFRAEILTPYDKIITIGNNLDAEFNRNISLNWVNTGDDEQEAEWGWSTKSILEHYSPEKKYDVILYDVRL